MFLSFSILKMALHGIFRLLKEDQDLLQLTYSIELRTMDSFLAVFAVTFYLFTSSCCQYSV
jgi:hypothetical protein